MLYAGIDLAERHSAVVVVTPEGEVTYESTLDAGQQEKPPNPWKNIGALRHWWDTLVVSALVDEDVRFVLETPHFHARNGEPALMVQGGLLSLMLEYGYTPAQCPRIKAMEWQQYFGFSKSEHGDTKAWAAQYAKTYCNYEPGMTWDAGTRMVKKMREDLNDARLLAEWIRLTSLSETLAS